MDNNKKAIRVLNSLVEINNDRIEGYELASKEVKDSNLKSTFSQMGSRSQIMKSQLESEVRKLGEEPAEGTKASGKIHRMWMELKDSLNDGDTKSVLKSCEFGEDAIQEEYESALKDSDDLPTSLVSIIRSQKSQLLEDHDKIKTMRDQAIDS